MDMLILGFFFLLRPGEYAYTTNLDAAPFCLQDVHLRHHSVRLPHMTCSLNDLDSANFLCLKFTTQKNGVRGEVIGLGMSGNPAFRPVRAAIRRVHLLRLHNASPTTPLYAYYSRSWHALTTTVLTQELRRSVTIIGAAVGLQPDDISIRSPRASGAMALLCANIDPDRIRLLGCWRSDEMLCYLHVQAYPVVAHLAPAMLQHGHFHLIPNFR
jgi:hypothetical protein